MCVCVGGGGLPFATALCARPSPPPPTRTRPQIDPATGKMPYSGVANCAATILRKEGLLAFWRGFGAYYGRCAPHAMTILMVREAILSGYNTTFGL